ncbi:unnamed protein product [Ilex paraguariensis]|uniref:Protein kinase domain-containing protein n=1 Tax=Ilex paraguariensis TaxID=185542 RepID=A0ABC8QZJ2_9AQUA
MTAHVGDFGLARFLLNASICNSAHHISSSIGPRGSTGYVTPEYGMGSAPSTHGDVYSYDIVLLEMFLGKRLTDEIFNGNLNLHNYVRTITLLETVTSVADPRLLQSEEVGETSINHWR